MNQTSRAKCSVKKMICGLGGLLICIALFFIPAPTALTEAALAVGCTGEIAMRILGITLLAILWWSGEVVPEWVISLIMMLLWVVAGKIPFSKAFSAFSGTTIWLIVGSFCLAAGISKTGLFKRISWFLIRLFSPTFRGQVLAMLLVGTICSPLVPSSTAKAVLGASIAKNIADTMGYAPNSRGRCGLFIAAFIGFSQTTPAFLSASVFTYAMLGILPEEIRSGITWTSWLLATIPWLLVVLIGSFIFIQLLFTPNEDSLLTADYIKQEYAKLGKMDRQEKLSAFVLAGAVLFWILENQLQISAAVTALAVVCVFFGTGILKTKEIETSVPWGLVLFLGGVLNLGTIFSAVGLDTWLQSLLLPFFSNLSTPLALLLVVSLITFLLRLVMVSQTATVIIMLTILNPIVLAANISPFIIGFIILAMQQCWFFSYQNSVFIPAFSCMQGTLAREKTLSSCAIFELLALLGCLVSLPYWKCFHMLFI